MKLMLRLQWTIRRSTIGRVQEWKELINTKYYFLRLSTQKILFTQKCKEKAEMNMSLKFLLRIKLGGRWRGALRLVEENPTKNNNKVITFFTTIKLCLTQQHIHSHAFRVYICICKRYAHFSNIFFGPGRLWKTKLFGNQKWQEKFMK